MSRVTAIPVVVADIQLTLDAKTAAWLRDYLRNNLITGEQETAQDLQFRGTIYHPLDHALQRLPPDALR